MTPRQKTRNGKISYAYSGPFKKGLNVAKHYGFELIKPARGSSRVRAEIGPRSTFHKDNCIDPVHKILMHEVFSENFGRQKNLLMLCNTRNAKKRDDSGINLYMLGSSKGVAEALIIKTSLSILNEYRSGDFMVDINSLGDRASYKDFLRDFSHHYRKSINIIGDCCRTTMKNDLSSLPDCEKEECKKVLTESPKSINYLTEGGRGHFKNVLEYMEAMKVPYRINCDLMGEHPEYGTQTIFVITEGNKKKPDQARNVVARGERYTRCVRNGQHKKVSPTVSIAIDIPGGRQESYREIDEGKVILPELYLIHLGIEAKRKSLYIIELLRRDNIAIAQSLAQDGLSQQINMAESMSVPYTIIIGLKEVKEQSVIVRNMNTRAQETVPVVKLLRYLKHVQRL